MTNYFLPQYFSRIWWISPWSLLPIWLYIAIGIIVCFVAFCRNYKEGKKDKKLKVEIATTIVWLAAFGIFSSFSSLYNLPFVLRSVVFWCFIVFFIIFQLFYMNRKKALKDALAEAHRSILRAFKWHGPFVFILMAIGIAAVIAVIIFFIWFLTLG